MLRYLAELYRFRDLLFWLAAKEIKVRYKSPVLGFLWALLVPLSLSFILWLIVTLVLPMPAVDRPWLFLIAGIFPWNFFAQSVSTATMSILDAGPLIKKTAFPRAVVPLSIVAANFVNFLLAFGVVLGILLVSRVPLTPWMGLLPVVIGLHVAMTVGVVLLVAGLQVRYRDMKYLVEVGLLLWFYLTPIFYPLSLIAGAPAWLRWLYLANPFVYLIELYRLSLLGGAQAVGMVAPAVAVQVSAAASLGMLLVGFLVFRRQEPDFADWVVG